MKDGSMLALGLRAHQAHREVHRQDRICRTSPPFRLELLTDPNLPAGGPGRSIKGTGALTEFRVEAAAARRARQDRQDQDRQAPPPISTSPRRRSRTKFDDKSGKRIASPARSSSPSTAATKPPGASTPGRACAISRARPYSISKSPSTNTGGTDPQSLPEAESRRLRIPTTTRTTISAASASRSPTRRMPSPTRCPTASAPSCNIPRDQPHAGAGSRPYSAIGAPRFRNGSTENDAIAQLWREYPEGVAQLVLAERTEDPRETHILKRGDFLQPDRAVTPGVPAFLNPLPAGAAAQPPDVRAMAGRSRDRPPPRAPSSIASGRPISAPASWPRSRISERSASRLPTGTARLAGGRVHGFRLELEEAAAPDRHLGHVPPVVERHARTAGARIPTIGCSRAARASASTPK